jgi:hypothetical protein
MQPGVTHTFSQRLAENSRWSARVGGFTRPFREESSKRPVSVSLSGDLITTTLHCRQESMHVKTCVESGACFKQIWRDESNQL